MTILKKNRLKLAGAAILSLVIAVPASAREASENPPIPSPYIEELTWPEIKTALEANFATVIIPTGGTEQNGPHMATGKHNYIVRYTSGEIAKKLGHTLVAPVVAYVPEGTINPPEGHMKFPGTISVSEEHFAAVLEDAAHSFKQHGFTLICFIGDSGGNQRAQAQVAEKLTREWTSSGSGAKVLHVSHYYDEGNGQNNYLITQLGERGETEMPHANMMDTSELMYAYPPAVRNKLRGQHSLEDYETAGATGDSSKATAKIGKTLLDLKIDAAVEQIRAALSP